MKKFNDWLNNRNEKIDEVVGSPAPAAPAADPAAAQDVEQTKQEIRGKFRAMINILPVQQLRALDHMIDAISVDTSLVNLISQKIKQTVGRFDPAMAKTVQASRPQFKRAVGTMKRVF